MITFEAPLMRRNPLPLMTPLLPDPTILLLLATCIGFLAAFVYVHETHAASQVSMIQYCPLGWQVLVQHCVDVDPSELVKSQVWEIMMTRGVESVSHDSNLGIIFSHEEIICMLTSENLLFEARRSLW